MYQNETAPPILRHNPLRCSKLTCYSHLSAAESVFVSCSCSPNTMQSQFSTNVKEAETRHLAEQQMQ